MTLRKRKIEEPTKPGLAADLACMVLDSRVWKYDRLGWHQVARNLANKLLSQSLEVERLTKRVRALEAQAAKLHKMGRKT